MHLKSTTLTHWCALGPALLLTLSACASNPDVEQASSSTEAEAASTAPPQTSSPSTTVLPAPANPTQPRSIGLDSQRNVREAYFSHLQGDIEGEWGTAPLLLTPGEWTTTQLGVTVSFELDDPLLLWEDNPDYVELAPPNTDNAQTRSLLAMMRPSWIISPNAVGDQDAAQERLGAAEASPRTADDFEAWLAGTPQVDVVESTDTTVGGLAATRWTLSVNPAEGPTYSCLIGSACVSTWVPTSCECRRLQVPLAISNGAVTTVWFVEQPGSALIIVARALDAEAGFVETAASIVDTITLVV